MKKSSFISYGRLLVFKKYQLRNGCLLQGVLKHKLNWKNAYLYMNGINKFIRKLKMSSRCLETINQHSARQIGFQRGVNSY